MTKQCKIGLKRGLRVHQISPNSIAIGSTPPTSTELSNLSQFHMRSLELLDSTRTLYEINIQLKKEGFVFEERELQEFISELSNQNLIQTWTSEDLGLLSLHERERYDRQLQYFSLFAQERIKAYGIQKRLLESCIAVIGIGGVGSYLTYGLVAIGVEEIVGVDGDSVELSNISRQILYNEKDIGRLKVDVAREKLSRVNSHTQLDFISHNISSSEELKELLRNKNVDFLILSADTPRGLINQWVNEACVETRTSFCEVGSSENLGVCGPIVIPGKTPCWRCGTLVPDIPTQGSLADTLNQRFSTAIFDPMNAAVASIALLEVTKHLTNFSECRLYGRRLFIDFASLQTYFDSFSKDSNCPICKNI